MSEFLFKGNLETSKSLMNRALILASYNPELRIEANSSSDDVQVLRKSLEDFRNGGTEFWVGDAGTSLRFLALRLSRATGSFLIRGTERLFSRPIEELVHTLNQLGAETDLSPQGLRIRGRGEWRTNSAGLVKVQANNQRSSQFSSAVLLNTAQLAAPLELSIQNSETSKSYLEMTLALCQELGLEIKTSMEDGHFLVRVPQGQSVQSRSLRLEADASSCFAVMAAAALAGECLVSNWPQSLVQPDTAGLSALLQMGAVCKITDAGLSVVKGPNLKGLRWSFKNTPDLFPVMAVLAAFADGESCFEDLQTLEHKESNRLRNSMELLRQAGVDCQVRGEKLIILGKGFHFQPRAFEFDPDHDHRMAMAAGILQLREPKIQILNPEVVSKSFPHFWQILRGEQ